MIKLTKVINDPSGIVSKLIFEDETAIAETVAYKYKDRGVICFSVSSGCQVGCAFCGTGKKFIRHLSYEEIELQIKEAYKIVGNPPKMQLMSMSMGEPLLNWGIVRGIAKNHLRKGEYVFVSTVGLDNTCALTDIISLGKNHPKFGLQFSLHSFNDISRRRLLGNYSDLMSIDQIIKFGKFWSSYCGKPAYYNYICTGKETGFAVEWVARNLAGMHLTCSVMCDINGLSQGDINPAKRFAEMILDYTDDVEVSVFDPAGQDTIGGGCGQLLYVQEKLNGYL